MVGHVLASISSVFVRSRVIHHGGCEKRLNFWGGGGGWLKLLIQFGQYFSAVQPYAACIF